MEKDNIINTKMITLIYFVFILYTLTAYMNPNASFIGATIRILLMDSAATCLFIFVFDLLTSDKNLEEIVEQIKSGARDVRNTLQEKVDNPPNEQEDLVTPIRPKFGARHPGQSRNHTKGEE